MLGLKQKFSDIFILPTGEISMADINTELGTTGERSLGQQDGRDMVGVPSGEISFELATMVLAGSLVMSMVGALIPAVMASRIDPIILIHQGE